LLESLLFFPHHQKVGKPQTNIRLGWLMGDAKYFLRCIHWDKAIGQHLMILKDSLAIFRTYPNQPLILLMRFGIKAAIPLANTFHVTWLEPCTTLQKPVFHRIENVIPCKVPLT